MNKKLLSVLVFGSAFILACGGGSNADKVCSAAVDQLFLKCDKNDPADVQIVWNALQGAGLSVSAEEIQNGNAGDVKGLCVDELNKSETTITDEEAAAAIAAFKATTSCQQLVDLIVNASNG